jgi:anti-sigma regulatory factor (Ser/Thr protein kinase)
VTESVVVRGMDQAGEARRRASSLAASLGFDEHDIARVALVATEAASNIVKHAGEGEILLNATGRTNPAVEVIAVDKGPGMGDVQRCFQDGYSTAGSAGTGLGAIRRISAECDVFTEEGKGTALLARLRPARAAQRAGRARVGAVSVPMAGENVCGDGWAARQGVHDVTVMVVDGLGHGQPAADCASKAVSAFESEQADSPADMIGVLHGAARSTRGGAAAVARIEPRSGQVWFSGIGNIAAMVAGAAAPRRMVSYPGIIGHDIRLVREFTYAWRSGDVLLLYSDGISTHWSLESYPGLQGRDPSVIAAVVYRDWTRKRDDATVVVCKWE